MTQAPDRSTYADEPTDPFTKVDMSTAWVTDPDGPEAPPGSVCVRMADSLVNPGHITRVWVDPTTGQPLMFVVDFPVPGGRYEPRPWTVNAQHVQHALRAAKAAVGSAVSPTTDAEVAAQALEVYVGDAEPTPRPRGGSLVFSRLIAGVYRLAMDANQGGAGAHTYAPAPVTKIALLWGVSRAAAQNWIEEARRDGFLASYMEERRFALRYPPEDPSPYARAQRERNAPAAPQPPVKPEPPRDLTEDERWLKEAERMAFKYLASTGLTGMAIKAGKLNADDTTDADEARVASSLAALELSPKWLQVTADALRVYRLTGGGRHPERSDLTPAFLAQRHADGMNLYGRPPAEGDPPTLRAVVESAPPVGQWLIEHGLYEPPAAQPAVDDTTEETSP